MTIDERLDAISRNLELLSTLHLDLEQQTAAQFAETDRRWAETDRRWAETDKRWAETDKRFAEVAARFSETLVFINRLANVAEAHEQRLDEIERGQDR